MNIDRIFLYLQVLTVRGTDIGHEYMGSAEFEWGSIQHAWHMLDKERKRLLKGVFNVGEGFDLHWAAVPTFHAGGVEQPLHMHNLLRAVIDNKVRGKERFRTRDLQEGRHHGWLSVDGSVNAMANNWKYITHRCHKPCFVVMTSAEGLKQALKKAKTYRDWEPKQ